MLVGHFGCSICIAFFLPSVMFSPKQCVVCQHFCPDKAYMMELTSHILPQWRFPAHSWPLKAYLACLHLVPRPPALALCQQRTIGSGQPEGGWGKSHRGARRGDTRLPEGQDSTASTMPLDAGCERMERSCEGADCGGKVVGNALGCAWDCGWCCVHAIFHGCAWICMGLCMTLHEAAWGCMGAHLPSGLRSLNKESWRSSRLSKPMSRCVGTWEN